MFKTFNGVQAVTENKMTIKFFSHSWHDKGQQLTETKC